jgi:hypothetical protein
LAGEKDLTLKLSLGTGLSLLFRWTLAELLGAICFAREYGQGSTFVLAPPRA